MSQVEMRAELARRGLVNYGANHALRTRLQSDEARGVFKGNLVDMSDEYLREGCQILSIPRTGDRQSLINNIRRYNAYKRQKIAQEEAEGSLNAGLPTPDDRLGEPTEDVILGTRDSSTYSKPYSEYLDSYKLVNSTTKDALTFQYWETLQ